MPQNTPPVELDAIVEPNQVETIVRVAQEAAGRPASLGSIYAAVKRDDQALQLVDLEYLDERPRRKVAEVSLIDAGSFCAYTNRHTRQATTIYAHVDRELRPSIVAIIDDDEPDGPTWREHRAVLNLQQTEEWRAWLGINRKALGQVDFAEFLEDHARECVDPDAATFREIAETLEATGGVEFRSATRLANGTRQITWHETVDARAGQHGELEIPERLRLALSVWEGADPREIDARFRFRLAGGEMRVTVILDRPDLVIREEVDKVLDAISAQTEPHVVVLAGTAPPPRAVTVVSSHE